MSRGTPGVMDDATIREALEQADPLALRAVLFQLTGDESLASMEMTTAPSLLSEVAALARADDIAAIKEKAFSLMQEIRDGKREVTPPPSRDELHRIMNLATG